MGGARGARALPPLPAVVRVRRRADGAVEVTVAGVPAGRVSGPDWERLGFRDGQLLQPDDGGPLSAALARAAAHAQALRLLAVRDRSRAELSRRLALAHGPDAAAFATTAVASLLDDERFARAWVGARQRFRPLGPPALFNGLRRQGVAPDLARRVVADMVPPAGAAEDRADDAEDVRAACRRAAEARARRLPAASDAARRALTAHLARRGFAYVDIEVVVREVLGES